MRHLSAEDWSQPLPAPPVLSSGAGFFLLRAQALLHEGARDNDGQPQDGGPCYGFARDKVYPEEGQEGARARRADQTPPRGTLLDYAAKTLRPLVWSERPRPGTLMRTAQAASLSPPAQATCSQSFAAIRRHSVSISCRMATARQVSHRQAHDPSAIW